MCGIGSGMLGTALGACMGWSHINQAFAMCRKPITSFT